MKRLLAAIGLPFALIAAPIAHAEDLSCELYGGLLVVVAIYGPVTLCSSSTPAANPPGVSVVPAVPTTPAIPGVPVPAA